MTTTEHIWLASYPRSGNTLLRIILRQCFGLRSSSVYRRDLGHIKELEDVAGHVEKDGQGQSRFPRGGLPLIKTHRPPVDDRAAIYVVRDGRAASASMFRFYERKFSLDGIIEGLTPYGTWCGHLEAWHPWDRPHTLLLRYEDLVADVQRYLPTIGTFLGRAVESTTIPERAAIARIGGRWVSSGGDWREIFSAAQLRRFEEMNGAMLTRLGYGDGAGGD